MRTDDDEWMTVLDSPRFRAGYNETAADRSLSRREREQRLRSLYVAVAREISR